VLAQRRDFGTWSCLVRWLAQKMLLSKGGFLDCAVCVVQGRISAIVKGSIDSTLADV
jgi:hypothetical protein